MGRTTAAPQRARAGDARRGSRLDAPRSPVVSRAPGRERAPGGVGTNGAQGGARDQEPAHADRGLGGRPETLLRAAAGGFPASPRSSGSNRGRGGGAAETLAPGV